MINPPKRKNNEGFASGLELENAKRLLDNGIEFWYEEGPCIIEYTMNVRKAECNDCGSLHVVSKHKYSCDFVFTSRSGKQIYVECKGHPLGWTGKTRNKHQEIKKQYPEMDLRFVFNNKHAKISRTSKTTNAQWCKRQGFECASSLIPLKWLEE